MLYFKEYAASQT